MKSKKQKFSFITALLVVVAFALTTTTQARTNPVYDNLNIKTYVQVNTLIMDGGKYYNLKCNGESTEAKSSKSKTGSVTEKKAETSGMKCGEGKMSEGKMSKSDSVSMKKGKTSEGKCGEGKCGEGKMSKSKTGKSGSASEKKKAKTSEGKCGAGKCGTAKM
ncbi:MAG TPA: hypothetical protein ENH02_01660 [Bacteroidetes bacterium]|nr:hypothetical protein [Bacteroidota bacterium]